MRSLRAPRGHVACGLLFGLLFAVFSAHSLSAQQEDIQSTLDGINAAIAARGANWIAGPTEPMLRPSSELCGLDPAAERTSPDSGGEVPAGVGIASDDPLPSFWDWRNKDGHDWTTRIQNQGGCGACYIFAACAAAEAAIKIAAGPNGWQLSPDFAEQFIMSCLVGSKACAGGGVWPIYDLLINQVAPPDACFPYTANDDQPCSDRCPDWESRITKISGWQRVGNTDFPSIEQTKRAIMDYGPVSTGFDVYTDFKSYSGGVYTYAWGSLEGGHAVIIVGWDDSQQCWIAKNSWGTNWGETRNFQPWTTNPSDGGWFRIKYNESWFGYATKYPLVVLPNLSYHTPSEWTSPLVPRNTVGATPTNCTLTSTLSGEGTNTYVNYAVRNTSTVSAAGFAVSTRVDGQEATLSEMTGLAGGTVSYANNYGPITVRGGRHTLSVVIDPEDRVPEPFPPNDNEVHRQYVWSPKALAPDTSALRTAPPVRDAWGNAPLPRYDNCDGYSFVSSNAGWSAVGLISSANTGLYDLKLWGLLDYQNSTTGFGPNWIQHSQSAGTLCDFVVVNGLSAPVGTYYAGVINTNAGAADYRIEHKRGVPLYTRPGIAWNGPYSKPPDNVLDIYEVNLQTGEWAFNLNHISGDCPLDFALYNKAGNTFSKDAYMPGAMHGSNIVGDRYFTVNIPEPGMYGLAVYKRSSSGWDKPVTYRLGVSRKAIYLVTPNGGEIMGLGETYPITWENFGTLGSTVKIQISRDGGVTWSTIVENAANMGVYNWTVSGQISRYCRIKVRSNGGDYEDTSDGSFSIVVRDITVTSPAGGENWTFNTPQEITWTSFGFAGNVRIELSRDGGSTWQTIAASTPNDGAHPWTATLPGSNRCRIRVSSVDAPVCSDTSDADFTIAGPGVQVVSPNGGEVWVRGETRTVAWTSSNLTTPVAIELSRNNGSTWETITASTPNDGNHDWTVAGTASAQCLVRVRSVDYAEASDTSNAVFSIGQRSITLISPAPYQVLQIGSPMDVAWTGEALEGPVKIEISRDNRATWKTLIEAAETGPTGGQVRLAVSPPGTNSGYIRLTCVNSPSISDTNVNYFRIVGTWVEVQSPNGAQTLLAGDVYGILWNAVAITGMCEVQLSTDSGSTWQTVASNRSIQNGYYAWTVPDISSTTCRIRVVSLDYPAVMDDSDADFTIARRTIEVISPVGGETWCVGSTREVRWTSRNVDGNVRIILRELDASGENTLLSVPNTGSCTLTAPLVSKPRYTVVVKSVEHSSVQGSSAGPITIAESALTVLSPDGGEEMTIGAPLPITWDPCNVSAGNVKIDLSRDGGTSWATIIADTPNDGAQDWTATGPEATQCRIRITSLANPSFTDTSNADFSLVSRSIQVVSPNGGESWEAGSAQYIRWSRSNCPGPVKIEITRNNRLSWQTIVTSTSATGEYLWVVTSPLTSQALIRVTSVQYPSVGDSSNALFTVTDRGITVLTPGPGTGLTLGVPTTITWTSRNLPHGDVKIELSRNNGSTWEMLAASAPNIGSRSWTPSGKGSGECLIRITSLADPSISDITDGVFSLANRSITLESPVGGETWGIGRTNLIRWRSSNVSGSVKIELTRDDWAASEMLSADAENTGTFQWSATGPASSACRVRVSANSHPGVSGQSASVFSILEPVTVPLKVTLQDWLPGPDGMPVNVKVLKPDTAAVLEQHDVVLGPTGSTSFETILLGTRDLWVKASHWLSALNEDVEIDPDMLGVVVSLKNGDSSGDNVVDRGDFAILKEFWGTKNPANPNADLNGDTLCDVQDLSITRVAWNQTGGGGVIPAGPTGASMWLGDARGRRLSEVVCVAGDPFDIYVWASATVPVWFLNASVGFDRTPVPGTGAFPMDRRIVLANNDPGMDLQWGDISAAFIDDLGIRLGGLFSSLSLGFRPYGVDFACARMGGSLAPFSATKVARLTLVHRLEPGATAPVILWNDGSRTGGFWQSMMMGTGPIHMDSQTVQVRSYLAGTILEARLSADGSPASIAGAAVTASFPNFLYIEADDRSVALRVEAPGQSIPPDTRVDVGGTMETAAHGERVLVATSLAQTGASSLVPVGMGGLDVGGRDWRYNPATGAGQRGVAGGAGINTIGMLIHAWGRVIEVESASSPAWFTLDDGSGRNIRCTAVGGSPAIDPGWQGRVISVTGVVSCERSGDDLIPIILLKPGAPVTVH
ncbi:MAG: C1 family peptidase [Armatimonadota bacterium]